MRTIYLFFALSLLVVSCARLVDDGNNNIVPVDTCGNNKPISTIDSATGAWWMSKWSTVETSFSPDRIYYATTFYMAKPWTNCVVVYNNTQKIPLFTIPWFGNAAWSPDGKELALIPAGGGSPFVVNIETQKMTQLTTMNNFAEAVWDESGEYLYLARSSYNPDKPFPENKWGTFRVKRDGSEFKFITDSLFLPQVVDHDNLISFYTGGPIRGFNIVWYNVLSRTFKKDSVLGYDGNTINVYNVRISPDKSKLVFERNPLNVNPTYTGSPYAGVWILDLKTLKSRQLLPEQAAWFNEIKPRWYSDTELLCNFYCRKDSATTTWLVDINGRVLRQITTKGMKLIP